MLGFLFRFLGCFVLASAVAVAVGDIARSLSADAIRLSTIGECLDYVMGQSDAVAVGGTGTMVTERLESFWAVALQWPAAPVLAALALVLLVLGRRPREARLVR